LERMKAAAIVRLVAIILLTLIIVVTIVSFMIPQSQTREMLLDFMYWLRGIPKSWGTTLLATIYAFGLIICFPGTPFNLAAGFLFGIWIGSATSVAGCIGGATLSFFVGRSLAREWAQNLIKQHEKAKLINLAMEQNGWVFIFMIRLSPILPFGICNYIFGVSNVKFWIYWTATFAGLLPCTIAYTYLGSLMRNLADLFSGEGGTDQTIILVVSVVSTVLGIIIITAVTKRTLDKTLAKSETESLIPLNKEEEEKSYGTTA